jgi:5-methyltetrahydrofolate--homocysteine methyltransferase
MIDLAALTAAVQDGDYEAACRWTREALDQGIEPGLLLGAMVSAMDTVGALFQANEIFVPEMLISAYAMKEAMAILEPALVAAGLAPEHRAVIGTVEGDLHDIGKNLVAMMWKGAGLEVIDLGINVPSAAFAEAVRVHRPHVVGISALLTTTMTAMGPAVTAIREVSKDVKVIVGGAPVTPEFAVQVGADAYAPDAGAAVSVIKRLIAGT